MGKAGKLDLEMKEILRSFEQAEKDTSSLPLNPPPADEFDRIWTRIQAERELIPDPSPTVKPRRRCINKIFAVGVAAAVLTVGGCFVAMGTKSYFYRDGRMVKQGIVYNNDSKVITVRDEEEAYEKISEELGVKTLRLGYIPEKMYFWEMGMGNCSMNMLEIKYFLFRQKTRLRHQLCILQTRKKFIIYGIQDYV